METEAEIHSQAPGQAPRAQLKIFLFLMRWMTKNLKPTVLLQFIYFVCYDHLALATFLVCVAPGVHMVHMEDDIRALGTRVWDGCGLPCRCLETNLDPLQGQRALLTAELTP